MVKINERKFEQMCKEAIEKFAKILDEEARKRQCYPIPALTDLEHSVLLAIADGRVEKELEGPIRFLAEREGRTESYSSITRTLLEKFDAFTILHVIYKAMRVGIIK